MVPGGEKERWKQMMAWRDSGGQRVAAGKQPKCRSASHGVSRGYYIVMVRSRN